MVRLRTLVAYTALAVLGGALLAQSGGGTTDAVTRLDRALQFYVDEGRIAGAVALVLRDGQPLYERAIGWSDKEAGRRMTTGTIFRIASQTKAITSTAVLSLVEAGRIGLDDPAGRYISSFATTTVAVRNTSGVVVVPATRPITVRDLLTHTSGISYGTEPEVAALYESKGLGPAAGPGWYTADKSESICDTMDRLGTLPFVAQPGEEWVYGYSTDVLGCIVERASGVPLDEYVKTHITDPLGMADTRFFLRPADRARFAVVYSSGADGRVVRSRDGPKGQGDYVDGPRQNFSGGAGLTSTARDYARFLEMIRKGGALGSVRILAPDTVALMTTNQVGERHSPGGLGFGFGFQITERYGAAGREAIGSFGWSGAYGTLYRVDPKARMVLLLMIQLMPNTTDIRGRFEPLVYEAFGES